MRSKFHRLPSSVATLLLICAVGQASATPIGPGAGINGILETPDKFGRINVDDANFVELAAGIYQATTFSFDAGSASSVTAFLAYEVDADTYRVLAKSALHNVRIGVGQSVTFGGFDLFTLSALTNVYAGIATFGAPNPILFRGGSTTDHDSRTLSSIGVGDIVSGFNHANLGRQFNFRRQFNFGRQYNFEIEVEAASVPEPGSLALLGIGLAGLGLARRRKKV